MNWGKGLYSGSFQCGRSDGLYGELWLDVFQLVRRRLVLIDGVRVILMYLGFRLERDQRSVLRGAGRDSLLLLHWSCDTIQVGLLVFTSARGTAIDRFQLDERLLILKCCGILDFRLPRLGRRLMGWDRLMPVAALPRSEDRCPTRLHASSTARSPQSSTPSLHLLPRLHIQLQTPIRLPKRPSTRLPHHPTLRARHKLVERRGERLGRGQVSIEIRLVVEDSTTEFDAGAFAGFEAALAAAALVGVMLDTPGGVFAGFPGGDDSLQRRHYQRNQHSARTP